MGIEEKGGGRTSRREGLQKMKTEWGKEETERESERGRGRGIRNGAATDRPTNERTALLPRDEAKERSLLRLILHCSVVHIGTSRFITYDTISTYFCTSDMREKD